MTTLPPPSDDATTRTRSGSPDSGPASAWPLALAGVLSALTLILVAAGVDAGVVAVAYWFLVPGLLVRHALLGRGRAAAGVGPVVGVSLAALVIVSTFSLWVEGWQPRWTTVVIASLTLLAALGAFVRSRTALSWSAAPFTGPLAGLRDGLRREDAVLVGLGLLALVGWIVALFSIDPADASVGGLLVGASPLFAMALAVAVVVFLAAVRLRSWPGAVAGFVVSLLALRLTTPIVAEEPLYNWTFKHMGVVDFIQEQGRLVGSVDIYHNWPGFFAGAAWLGDIAGISPHTAAHWFPPLVTLLTCAAVAGLARHLAGGSYWVGLVAAQVFLMLNWIGQDYFAPQAVALLLGVVALHLVLRRAAASDAVAVFVFAALVVTHQLTPFWVLAVVWVLLLGRRVRWWVPVAFTLLLGAYTLFKWDVIDEHGLISGFNPAENAQVSGGEFSSDAKRVDSWASRLATALAWIGAGAALLWERRRKREWFTGAALCVTPFIFLAAQDYGGEALLRVALYSLVGCAAVIAPALIAALRSERLVPALAVGAVTFVAAAGATQAYFGPWYAYQVSPAEARVDRLLLEQVPRPAYIAPAIPSWPDRSVGEYADWVEEVGADYDNSAFMPWLAGTSYSDAGHLIALERERRVRSLIPTYVIVSKQMETTDAYRGFLGPGAFENLRTKLERRAGWSKVLEDEDVAVFRYVPAEARGLPSATWTPQ